MLYLFNKVYVKPDTNFRKTKDMVIMSPVASSVPTDEFLLAVMEIDLGKVHYAGESYQAVVDQFGSENAFFDYLTNFDDNTRLVIYANVEALTTIAYKWYKALLINADVDTAYKVFKTVFRRFEYVFGSPYNPTVKLSEADNQCYRAFGRSLPEYSEFVQRWNDTVPYDLSGKGYQYYAERCGLEFQLASYLADSMTPLAGVLETKLVSMVRKIHVRYLIDTREIILHHMDMLPDYDIHTQTMEDWVALHPEYKFLTDPKFLPDQWQYVSDTYGFDNLNIAFRTMAGWIGYDVGAEVLNLLDPFSFVTLESIVQLELEYVLWRMYISRWEYGVTTNTYLVEYILELKRSGNLEQLQKLSVG
jgi:hypothetical protein